MAGFCDILFFFLLPSRIHAFPHIDNVNRRVSFLSSGGDEMTDLSTSMETAITVHSRKISLTSFWTTFAINEVYAIVSGIAYASQWSAVENGPYLTVMALLVVLMGPFLILSMSVIHNYARQEQKTYSLAALGLMIACIAITSCNNFMLLIVSKQPNLFSESFQSLFLPCKWPTPVFVLDNFVWDWFFGVSMLLISPLFGGNILKNILRIILITSGVLCILGLIWIAISPDQAVIIGILGWGAAGPIAFLLLAKVFERIPVKIPAQK
jgi:hypothetical protein